MLHDAVAGALWDHLFSDFAGFQCGLFDADRRPRRGPQLGAAGLGRHRCGAPARLGRPVPAIRRRRHGGQAARHPRRPPDRRRAGPPGLWLLGRDAGLDARERATARVPRADRLRQAEPQGRAPAGGHRGVRPPDARRRPARGSLAPRPRPRRRPDRPRGAGFDDGRGHDRGVAGVDRARASRRAARTCPRAPRHPWRSTSRPTAACTTTPTCGWSTTSADPTPSARASPRSGRSPSCSSAGPAARRRSARAPPCRRCRPPTTPRTGRSTRPWPGCRRSRTRRR